MKTSFDDMYIEYLDMQDINVNHFSIMQWINANGWDYKEFMNEITCRGDEDDLCDGKIINTTVKELPVKECDHVFKFQCRSSKNYETYVCIHCSAYKSLHIYNK